MSVQLLFELNGSAARVRRTELGLETFGSGSHDLLEPMGFDDSYVITAPGVVACLLEHIQNGEYDKAYPLIAELEQGGAQKPDYASFETYMASLAKIKSFSVREQTQNKDSSSILVTVEITLDNDQGVRRYQLTLKSEGSIYKPGYKSLINMLGGDGV